MLMAKPKYTKVPNDPKRAEKVGTVLYTGTYLQKTILLLVLGAQHLVAAGPSFYFLKIHQTLERTYLVQDFLRYRMIFWNTRQSS